MFGCLFRWLAVFRLAPRLCLAGWVGMLGSVADWLCFPAFRVAFVINVNKKEQTVTEIQKIEVSSEWNFSKVQRSPSFNETD